MPHLEHCFSWTRRKLDHRYFENFKYCNDEQAGIAQSV